ncbi:MAG: recombinase family protein [Candidatus Methanomethylophilaceae archaeon]|nr:recombinase family protein [Candidatus Methanomethylophilaceae archaeon]
MKAAIYARVSTEDQAREGFSLDAQLDMLRAYCEAQGHTVVKEYVDDGYSGRNIRRPAYMQMMAEMEEWDVLMVIKMDRIHRNSKNFMIMMEELDCKGKGFSSTTESLDTSNAIGRFVVDMIQRLAQLESEQIGERTYVGLREKAESAQGLLGFRPPYGYKVTDQGLEIVPEESSVVRRMFEMYRDGSTYDMIAYTLNREQLRTRSESIWTVYNVRNILRNPVYAGYLRWEELIIPQDHESLVTVQEYNETQLLISSKVKDKRRRKALVLPPRGSVETAFPAEFQNEI